MGNIKYDHQIPPIGWYTAWTVKPNNCSSTLQYFVWAKKEV